MAVNAKSSIIFARKYEVVTEQEEREMNEPFCISPKPAPSYTKHAIRFGTDVYEEEFKRYLENLTNKKYKKKIMKRLHNENICEELRDFTANGEYVINKKLVEFIMKPDKNTDKNLEFGWETIEEAILKAENSILERYEKKKISRKMRRRQKAGCSTVKRLSG